VRETPETIATMLITEVGEDKAKEIWACLGKHFKRPPGRPKKATSQGGDQ